MQKNFLSGEKCFSWLRDVSWRLQMPKDGEISTDCPVAFGEDL